MWNFSNGSKLKDLLFHEGPLHKNPSNTEITSLICVYDPSNEDTPEDAHCVAVGWDKRIYQWALNTEEEEIESKPQLQTGGYSMLKQGHQDDIMSCVYCV